MAPPPPPLPLQVALRRVASERSFLIDSGNPPNPLSGWQDHRMRDAGVLVRPAPFEIPLRNRPGGLSAHQHSREQYMNMCLPLKHNLSPRHWRAPFRHRPTCGWRQRSIRPSRAPAMLRLQDLGLGLHDGSRLKRPDTLPRRTSIAHSGNIIVAWHFIAALRLSELRRLRQAINVALGLSSIWNARRCANRKASRPRNESCAELSQRFRVSSGSA